MNRSVYSIVLMDSVVERIDRLAKEQGTNRSALINQILAEKLSLDTPEKRSKDIFSLVTDMVMASGFEAMQGQADNFLSVLSAVNFKYNPTAKYVVELFRLPQNNTIGRLKVNFRTKSPMLIERLDAFFCLWESLEEKYISSYTTEGVSYTISEARLERELMLPRMKQGRSVKPIGAISMDNVASAITEYIKGFDRIMKLWFEFSDNTERAEIIAETEYVDFITKANYLI